MEAAPPAAPREGGWGAEMVADLRQKYAQMNVTKSPLSRRADVTAKVQVMADSTAASPSKVHPPLTPQGHHPPRNNHRVAQLTASETVERSSSSQPGVTRKFSMADFSIGRVVGAGSFGRVYIAKRHTTGQTFAIKSISKAACLQGGQVKHVSDERKLLSMMKHPFIVQLHGTFQDDECIYMVMEFVPGGEFFTLLRDRGRMREEHARFYAAQVVLSLEYLHSNNIIYRDLKPENLLVGSDGYLRLADMGFAKVVQGKTYTMCGTPDYMAPEVILNKGHTKAVDWWSFGCVVYEMLHGYPPFYTGKAKETYQKILSPSSLVMQESFSSYVRDLLQGLLQHNPDQRLGIWGQGVQVIKSHPWFGGLDWGHIYNKMYRPPHLRTITGNDEAGNFDNYSQLAPMQHPFKLTQDQQVQFCMF